LIDIAKLKTEASMWGKFKKYMDKQKAKAPKVQTPKLSPAVRFLTESDRFHKEMVNLAWQDWTGEEKADLENRMRDLKQGAEDILRGLGVAIDEEATEQERGSNLA